VTGDTVLLVRGTYPEQIDFTGKEIAVTGVAPGDSVVVAITVINASGFSLGSVVRFLSGEESASLFGGCRFIGNSAQDDGGGIASVGSTELRIEDCVLRSIRCLHGSGGGAAIEYGTITIPGTEISSYAGGGLRSWGIEGFLERVTVCANGGCGVLVGSSRGTIRGSEISANYSLGAGGGMLIDNDSGWLIDRCVVIGNTARSGGGVLFGGGHQPPPNGSDPRERSHCGGGASWRAS
jgi:predicted outer membrane repeat protein